MALWRYRSLISFSCVPAAQKEERYIVVHKSTDANGRYIDIIVLSYTAKEKRERKERGRACMYDINKWRACRFDAS